MVSHIFTVYLTLSILMNISSNADVLRFSPNSSTSVRSRDSTETHVLEEDGLLLPEHEKQNRFHKFDENDVTMSQHRKIFMNDDTSNGLRYLKSCNPICKIVESISPKFRYENPEPMNSFVSTVRELPPPNLMPTIGNGHIATVVNSPYVLMNGLYNGKLRQSHRARIPSYLAFGLNLQPETSDKAVERSYSMDFASGLWKEKWLGKDFSIEKTCYAHRSLNRVIVVELDIFRLKTPQKQDTLQLNLDPIGGRTSDDLVLEEKECKIPNCKYVQGRIVDPETPESPQLEVHVLYTPLINITIEPPTKSAERWKYFFYSSTSPNYTDASTAFQQAMTMIHEQTLLTEHVDAWREVWSRASLNVEANADMQRAINSAMYYIYSSLPLMDDPVSPFIGLSPTDLGHGTSTTTADDDWDYQGHVFWDQEIWVMPFLTLFRPDLSKIILDTRARVVNSAYKNAEMNGFRGAQFPWESAYTGMEVSAGETYGRNEQHITGDISLAWMKYAFATGDREIFAKTEYRNVLLGAAEFWDSRLQWDEVKRKYVINHVMPPDEYHQDVNNSAYTNLIAEISMQAPHKIFNSSGLGNEIFKTFHDKANEIYQPFDDINMYHPEYESYKIGTKVKQADVILMGYPLNAQMSEIVRKNDLRIYENVTDENGPAMTYAMFAIGYASVGEIQKTHENVRKTLKHVKGPFAVWTESRDGSGAVTFITGAGGFLQSIVNGYGGIRIRDACLEINPYLPYNVSEFKLNGLKYLGVSFNISVRNDSMSILQNGTKHSSKRFEIRFVQIERERVLLPGVPLILPRTNIMLIKIGKMSRGQKLERIRKKRYERFHEWDPVIQSTVPRY